MADHINIDYEGLAQLASEASRTSRALDAVPQPPNAELRYSPCTVDGIDDFQGEWDEKRGNLVEALESVTQALTMIAESFRVADTECAAALEGGD